MVHEHSLDQLVHDLLDLSLVMNEYKQDNRTIEVEKYIKLLDGYIELAQSHRDYMKGMEGIFGEYEKIGGAK
ncbi:hypothetical protein FZC83_01850 [Rossellomorea marisflavi]|uniref:Uncharacterized protein n=1 Tax=Rossellomorea marisflavi TaxID=189381 RepID=A0A5D4S079_9BACI|nr:hypothetical protein [Rossellomorea marisflavi]TYS56339.1 hypothetical protein FZC83_01850 [Rossellomorea marisflavi]